MTSEQSATSTDAATDTADTADAADGIADEPPRAVRTTFRPVPLPALVAVGFVTIGISPIAFQGGPWFLVYLVPLALAWWLVRTRTVVDGTALRVHSAVGSRRVGWDELATLRVVERGWVRAVRGDGSELALTGVRARDLGRVAAASGGRITMPTPEEIEDAREHERELEATRLRIARLRELQAEADAADGEPPAGEGSTPEDSTPDRGDERA